MAFKHFLQSQFMQSIFTFLPALRHTIEPPPTPAQPANATPAPVAEPAPAPEPVVEHWREELEHWKTLADKTSAERDSLREEAGRLHTEMQRLVHDLGQVRVEAEETWRKQEEELKQQAAQAVRATEEQLMREREEAVRAAEERLAREREEAIREAEAHVERAQNELRQVSSELEDSKREQQGLKDTLEARRAEVEQLQRIVGMDKVAEPEVVQLLKNLNDEIARTAKSAKDLFKLDRNTRANGKVAMDAAAAIEGWVGSALPGLLSTQYRGNAVLLQAALQAMAVAFSSWISSSYSFMHEHDQILDETYKYVMNSESQIVLGRWRALTHRYAKQGMPNLVDELTKMFIGDVRNLLLVAGSSALQIDNLISRTRENFRSVVDAAIKLRAAIGEDVISCDFETILIHPGDAFDAAGMIDAFEGVTAGPASKNVLCTAGLGLRRCRKVKMDGDANSQWEVTVLQKPQVVLQSAISQ